MKKALYTLVIFASLIIVPVISSLASAPPPPPPPSGPGTDTPIGGSAPVGSGLVMLLSMGAAYGAKKVFDARKKIEE